MQLIPIFLIMGKSGSKIIDCTQYPVQELEQIYKFYNEHKDYEITYTRSEL